MMDTLFLQTFLPTQSANYTLVWICVLIVLLCTVVAYFQYKKTSSGKRTSSRMQPLLFLLFGFLALIAAGTGFFSWWTTVKTPAVVISETNLETGFGKAEWKDIGRFYIHFDRQLHPMSGIPVGDTTRLLTIIEKSGKTHVLSEENYDIDAIGKALLKYSKEEK